MMLISGKHFKDMHLNLLHREKCFLGSVEHEKAALNLLNDRSRKGVTMIDS